ncbi:hypothetical protein [Virgibacillus sp. LDC-1]|uniref:hypothetical protein n=1 Tax=Virgibacillus sp. LDC-1 TaxID=3039856 RepID=UPI0024DE365C|nr:hypothetical protein [Virgibacillus sp. LDC-1]
MNNFRSLKLLDFFQPIFRALNIDYPLMRKMVAMKLLMDQRRVPSILSQNMGKPKKAGNQFLKSLFIYVFYGLALVPFLFLGENYMFQISIMFGIMMFILMTTMISDFSSVLLDVRDKTILHTKPVSSRTISAAKLVHITIYLATITGAFILIPSAVMIAVQGIAYFLLFLAEVMLLILFILALTALTYIFILRFFSGEKLKDIINYVQIALSLGIVIGYQIVARVFDVVDLTFTYEFSWWHAFIPPMWFGAPFEMLFNQQYTSVIIIFSLLAVAAPVLSIYVYYRLMPSFERNLQKLLEEETKNKRKKRLLSTFWEKLVCRSREERFFYRFSTLMLSRERDLKLKVYPTLGLAVIFPFVFLFNQLSFGTYEELVQGQSYLNIYWSNIIIGIVVYMLQFSNSYKGAWIFETTDMDDKSLFYSAALKGFLMTYYLPIFLTLSIIFTIVFSSRIIPDLLVVFLSTVLHTLIAYKVVNDGRIPFSKPFESVQQGGSSMKTFLLMIVAGIFAGIHYAITQLDFGVYVYLALLLIMTPLLWKIVFKEKATMKV